MSSHLILITFASALIYFSIGIPYPNMLRRNWLWFHCTANKHPSIYALALVVWAAIFIVFITWRAFEPLTKSRRSDFQENELDDYKK